MLKNYAHKLIIKVAFDFKKIPPQIGICGVWVFIGIN